MLYAQPASSVHAVENHAKIHLGKHFSVPALQSPIQTGLIHVWVSNLDGQGSLFHEDPGYLESLLSDAESQRAQRYHFAKDRQRFITRRALLRIILSSYLDVHPGQVQLVSNPFGKPAVDISSLPFTNANASRLQFNLSHSAGLVLFAFALDHDIGVDLELVSHDFEFLPIAQQFFSKLEQQVLWSLPIEQRSQAFYCCWTRKEAYIKAQGQGLSLPLDQFDVTLTPGEPARLLDARHAAARPASDWTILHLDPAPGFIGALAIQGQGWHWQIFDLNLL